MTNHISEQIRYIGADDLTLDLFESQYVVPEGMAYNSWLILDERIAVLDTVDRRCADEWMQALDAALQGRTPDYLVVHHLEPDHSAMIEAFLTRWPSATLVASKRAFAMLPQFFPALPAGLKQMEVGDGSTLPLGRHTLHFFTAPMVHWPEVVMSYESTEQILFSADAFGKFGAVCHEEVSGWACEARRYYFNICGKYGVQVAAALRKASQFPFRTIAPLHGPVLRGDLSPYLSLYDTWSSYRPEKQGVFVAYGSIHGFTAEAARAVAQHLEARGVLVEVKDLAREDLAESIESAFEMSHLLLLSATYDGVLFPIVHDFLHHLQIKGWQQRRVALVENGSWSPQAARLMREMLQQCRDVDILPHAVTLRGRMTDENLHELRALADELF